MGKPVMKNVASVKISKNCRKRVQGTTTTRGSYSSAKVPPRPRAYISEVADFRQLVQDLTGNGNQSPCSSSSPLNSLDGGTALRRSEGSHVLDDFEEVTGRESNASPYYPQWDSVYEPQILSLGEVESWLLETDSAVPFHESYAQEISIFDYVMGDL